MSQEEFLLKWNDHHASFFTIVEDLCRTEQLCDVTLACGGQVFETHKLILSVCSPYFRTLLNSRPDKHPIVYLKDVNPKHLEQLLSYMYRGEINVLQDDLGPLIETARGLQIKGLADAGGDGGNSRKEHKSSHNGLPSQPHNQPKRSRTSTPTPAPKMPRIEPGAIARTTPAPIPITRVVSPPGQEEEDHSIVEVDPGENPNVKSEGWMSAGGDGEIADYEIPSEQFEQDMQAEDEQYIQAGNDALSGQQEDLTLTPSYPDHMSPTWDPSLSPGVSPPPSTPSSIPVSHPCPKCGKEFHVPSLLERHMRIHTNERPYQCRMCGRSYSQSGNLNVHLKTIHGVVVDGGRSRAEPDVSRSHKCYICNRLFTTSSNMYQHIRVVHNIAIETSKSTKPHMNISMPPTLPMLTASPGRSQNQLDTWAKAHLNELKKMTSPSSGHPIHPTPVAAGVPVKQTGSGGRVVEPTIEDTLQQLSALAGAGAGAKESSKRKTVASNIYLMDQDKPITHQENENTKIKQECE